MSVHRTFAELAGWSDEEAPVKVFYQFHRATKGARDGRRGPPIEPNEPAHIEIDWIEGPDGKPVELPKAQENRIREEISEYLWEQQHCREHDE